MLKRRVVSLLRRLPTGVQRALRRLPGFQGVRDRMVGTPSTPGPGPGELRAVVYPPTWAAWDVMKQRPQYLLEAWANAGHTVYFVDIAVSAPYRVDGVNIVPSLDHVPREGVIIYTHFAPVRTMLTGFVDPVVVYDILDDLTIFDADEVGLPPERRVRHHHGPMMEEASVVIGSAPVLVDRHRDERGDILLIENGVDTGRFRHPGPVPGELAGLEAPVVGYHGMIARWFDFDLMTAVVHAMPEVTFAFVGPVDPRSKDDASALFAMPNVVSVGQLPSSAMPGVVKRFDVGIVPFLVDDMTRAVSPLKMYEYLAGGTPVVATPLPLCVDHPMVETASDPSTFVTALRGAIAASSDPDLIVRRQTAASEADWTARMQPLLAVLDQRGMNRVPT